jgi:hypothetical protein
MSSPHVEVRSTNVRVNGTKEELRNRILYLTVVVTGPFGVSSPIIGIASSVLGFIGFLLTYPLVVDRIKAKKTIQGVEQ